MKILVPVSFGKDSTTLADLMCKNNMQVDYIIFYDTLMEFPLMYEYADKVKNYFKSRYNKEIIILKPLTTFEEWCFGVIRDKNAKLFGSIRGLPHPTDGVCYWRREAKVKPSEKWIKENIDGDYKIAIGYTTDEANRKMKDDKFIYPLIDDFKMTEKDCREYLINQEMENPLYRFFNRTGCAMCPFQSDKAFNELYKNFPDVWEYMKWIEKRLDYYEKMGYEVANKYWRSKYRTLEQMEKSFKSVFDFELSDEPLKDCFCKI